MIRRIARSVVEWHAGRREAEALRRLRRELREHPYEIPADAARMGP